SPTDVRGRTIRAATAPSCITGYTAGCLLSFARPRNYRQPCRLADRHRAPHWRQGGGTHRTRTDRGSQARGRQEQSLISVSRSHSGLVRKGGYVLYFRHRKLPSSSEFKPPRKPI